MRDKFGIMGRWLAGLLIVGFATVALADTSTTNLLMTNQATGANPNTWGDLADANFERIDDKFGDVQAISTTGGTTDLSNTQELVATINVTGTLVSNAVLEFSGRGGFWIIDNNTTGAYTLTANLNGTTGVEIA